MFDGLRLEREVQRRRLTDDPEGAVLHLKTTAGLNYTRPGGWAAATLRRCAVRNTRIIGSGRRRDQCTGSSTLGAPVFGVNGVYLWLDDVEISDTDDAAGCPPIVVDRDTRPARNVRADTDEARAMPVVYASPRAQVLRLENLEGSDVSAAPAGPPPQARQRRMLAADDRALQRLVQVRHLSVATRWHACMLLRACARQFFASPALVKRRSQPLGNPRPPGLLRAAMRNS